MLTNINRIERRRESGGLLAIFAILEDFLDVLVVVYLWNIT